MIDIALLCLFFSSFVVIVFLLSFSGLQFLLRVEDRVDNDNHFASFFAKKLLQTMIVFREKMTRSLLFREKLKISDNRDNREAIIAISRSF